MGVNQVALVDGEFVLSKRHLIAAATGALHRALASDQLSRGYERRSS
jgi:hypothetical protein